jgi:hypothetical protein
MELLEVEVWVKVDEDGDYEVGCDEEECSDRYRERVDNACGSRMVKMTVKVPAPRPIAVTVEIEDDETDEERKVKVEAA